MNIPRLLWITLLLIPSTGFAQTNPAGQFGCGRNERAAFYQTDLKFVELTSPDAIKQWKTRPVLALDGFDAVKYSFTRAEFYRWHVPVPGREGFDQGAIGASTDRLALAIRVMSPHGESWFELANPEDAPADLLYIQQRSDGASDRNLSEMVQPAGSIAERDEMAPLLNILAATPDAKLPLFSLTYWHKEGGMYQVEIFTNHLLVDLRTGSPRLINALTCMLFEPIGGACSAQDQAAEGHDTLQCHWDAASNDFLCTTTSPYGGPHAARTAQRDFYLISDKVARTSLEYAEFLPDLGQFALRIRENPGTRTKGVLVTGIGPTTLLQHFEDLLPDADVFVFASPGAGDVWNTHLSLVTVRSNGGTDVQSISKWGIAGEKTDESEAPKNLVPLKAEDTYRTHIVERRAGFRAFDAALTAMPGQANLGHVLYWIGLEAIDGKLVSSAVRLASDGFIYGGCGQEYREGTAASIRKKADMAEATIRIQGQFNAEYTNPYPTEGPNCVWTSLLHWKSGAGFRTRKLVDNCKSAHQEVTITEDGVVSGQDAESQ